MIRKFKIQLINTIFILTKQNYHHKANKTTNKIKIDAEKGNKDDKLLSFSCG